MPKKEIRSSMLHRKRSQESPGIAAGPGAWCLLSPAWTMHHCLAPSTHQYAVVAFWMEDVEAKPQRSIIFGDEYILDGVTHGRGGFLIVYKCLLRL
jgi:hypothetical protein